MGARPGLGIEALAPVPRLQAGKQGIVLRARGGPQKGRGQRRGSRGPTSSPRASWGPSSSSMPTSSPRPAKPARWRSARCGDDAVAIHGPRRARDAILGLPVNARVRIDPDGVRRRVRRQARPLGAAVPRARGVEARPPGALHLHTAGEHGGDHEAPPRADARARRADARTARLTAFEFHGRVRHRRLRVLGADRRQPRADARRRPLRRAERPTQPRRAHQRAAGRSVPGFGVPQSRHRAGGALRRACRWARHRPLEFPLSQRSAKGRRRHRPGDRGQRGGSSVSRGP